MKLSFSLPSKPSSKHQQNLKPSDTFTDEDQAYPSSSTNKEYVTEFHSTKNLAYSQPKKLTIPPKPNEFRPHKKMKNLDLPPIQSSDEGPKLQFEVDPNSAAAVEPTDPNISYGLNLRQSTKSDADPATGVKQDSIDIVLLNRLRDDMKSLPEDGGFDDYSEVPVESFAAAVLAGYGWSEGKGIGRNAKEDVKVVEYKRRNAREGFLPQMPTSTNNESNGPERELKGNRGVHERKEEKGGRYHAGKDVRIIGGKKMGMKGRILELVGSGDAVILKLSSEEEVKVKTRDIADVGSVEEEKCLRKLMESKEEMRGGSDGERRRNKDLLGRQNQKDSREQRSKDRKKESKRHREEERSERKEKSRGHEPLLWLTSHIRVRIISKDLRGGTLYLKKGKVVDVVGPTTCDISMDESRELIQCVEQEFLETVLPRRGGPVLVLYGKHKGVYGSLMERNIENETGVVRDADTHALLNVRLEQIAEYTGDPSYLGY